MKPKVTGCCAGCDKELFDIKRRDPETRKALEFGAAHDDAWRLKFVLVDGTTMDITFCERCAEQLTPAVYPAIWRREMASWIEESGADHPTVKAHADNAILGLFSKIAWKELPR